MLAVWIFPLRGSLIAGFQFLDSLIAATSAPQQAAGAALARLGSCAVRVTAGKTRLT